MQVAPLPIPVLSTALPQDAVARAIPQVQAQAAAPLLQRAVDPSPSSERGQKSKTNQEKAAGGKGGGDGKRGGTVNIRV
jgi:hypothetical protein